jgi:hypothetical protein
MKRIVQYKIKAGRAAAVELKRNCRKQRLPRSTQKPDSLVS